MSHLLLAMVAAPALAAVVLLVVPRQARQAIRWISLAGAGGGLLFAVATALAWRPEAGGFQLAERIALVPSLGIHFSLAADGWSVTLVLLTGIIIVTGVLASWTVERREKEFFVLLLTLVTGVFGVFVSQDLFVFFLFYEIAVLPMYLLIGIWGTSHRVPAAGPFRGAWRRFQVGGREYAAMKLTLMLLVGSAAILVAIFALWSAAGARTFDLLALQGVAFPRSLQLWVFPLLWLGFGTLAGVFPFHTWSPDGHASAPTAVSMLHAGVLMKLGAFGVMRVGMVLAPEAAAAWAPVVGAVAVVNVLYGALCAAAQDDLKYIVAYSSVSHMGVVMLGAATLNPLGWNGAIFQMFAHGIMTGLFFALVGLVYERAHTRELARMGGFAQRMPAIAACFTLAALSSLGLPGTAGFVAEFLVFLGAATGRSAWWTVPAVLGAFVTAVYVLRAAKVIFWGPAPSGEMAHHLGDPRRTEWAAPIVLGAALLIFGFWPRLLLDLIDVTTTGFLGKLGMLAQVVPRVTDWIQLLGPALGVAALGTVVLGGDALFPGRGRAWGWFSVAALLLLLVGSFILEPSGIAPHGAYVTGPWTLYLQRVFLCAALLAVLGAMDWLEVAAGGRQAEYLALVLFSTSGMMVLPGARDWVLLVVAFELMGIPLYALSAWAKNDGPPDRPRLAAEAGLKLFVTGTASSALAFFGLALVVGFTRTTRIEALGQAPAPLLAMGMLLIVAGFGFKIGAVPFHFWVPDTYQGAPMPFVAFLSVAPKLGGIAALSVILLAGWGPGLGLWGTAVLVLSAASMVVGNLFALNQSDVRRLLGFSGVAQMGYVLVGLAAQTRFGLAMALFFMATYLFTNLGAFLVLHAGAEASGGHAISSLSGLSRRAPVLGAALLVFLLSLAGIPFVAGFWAKLLVLLAGYRAGLVGLVALGVVLAVVGLFYYLGVARSTFMSDGEQTRPVPVGWPLRLAIGACLVAVVGLGLWPRPLVDAAERAAADLLGAPRSARR